MRGTDSNESITKLTDRIVELPLSVPNTPKAAPTRIPPGIRAAVSKTSGIVWDVAMADVHPGPCETTTAGVLPSAPQIAHGFKRLRMVLDRNVETTSTMGRTARIERPRSRRPPRVILVCPASLLCPSCDPKIPLGLLKNLDR